MSYTRPLIFKMSKWKIHIKLLFRSGPFFSVQNSLVTRQSKIIYSNKSCSNLFYFVTLWDFYNIHQFCCRDHFIKKFMFLWNSFDLAVKLTKRKMLMVFWIFNIQFIHPWIGYDVDQRVKVSQQFQRTLHHNDTTIYHLTFNKY